jgi:hypothetical protein
MAEPFGIAAGAISVAAAVAACVECSGYVRLGRTFGRDYQTDILSLDCAMLRLSRWGDAVNVHEDPKLGKPDATATEIQAAKNALHQILLLFEKAEKVSKKYRLKRTTSIDPDLLAPDDLDHKIVGLRNKMKDMALARQKDTSVLRKTSWAIYDRSELESLVNGIVSLVDSIEKLFPAPEARLVLAKQEAASIQNTEELKLLTLVDEKIDSLLVTAAKESFAGHQYLKVVIKGKVMTGNTYGSDWTGAIRGSSHRYDDVTVDEKGKALVGDKFGGKDFWDD